MIYLPEIGKILKETRESKNITLKEAENTTKIRHYYLQALEEEDFEKLPGKVYAIGFLKTYAKFLDIEYETLVDELKKKFSPSEEHTILPKKESERSLDKSSPLNLKRYISAVLAVAILVSIYFLYQGSADDKTNLPESLDEDIVKVKEDNFQDNNTISQQQNSDRRSESKDNFVPEYEGANLKLVIIDSKCWIRVHTDGKLIYEGTLVKGQEKDFKAEKEIVVRFGYPEAVKAIFNGEVFTYEGIKHPKDVSFKVE